MEFEWNDAKNTENIIKHGVSFGEAQKAFWDNKRVIAADVKHSTETEKRYFCFGMVDQMVMTVRFTVRNYKIRIIGAGYWREGRQRYEESI